MIPRRSSLVNCFGSGNESTRSSIMLVIFAWMEASRSLCDCGVSTDVVIVYLPSWLGFGLRLEFYVPGWGRHWVSMIRLRLFEQPGSSKKRLLGSEGSRLLMCSSGLLYTVNQAMPKVHHRTASV